MFYLNETISGPAQKKAIGIIQNYNWVKLSILSTSQGLANDMTGTVEFKATFEEDGAFYTMHDHSIFQQIHGRWFYTDSITPSCCNNSTNCKHSH